MTFDYLGSGTQNPQNFQINDVAWHPLLNIIFTVTEDRKIRIFDMDAKGKMIYCVENAHDEAISSIAINKSGVTFATASHDSDIKFWDIRRLPQGQQ